MSVIHIAWMRICQQLWRVLKISDHLEKDKEPLKYIFWRKISPTKMARKIFSARWVWKIPRAILKKRASKECSDNSDILRSYSLYYTYVDSISYIESASNFEIKKSNFWFSEFPVILDMTSWKAYSRGLVWEDIFTTTIFTKNKWDSNR